MEQWFNTKIKTAIHTCCFIFKISVFYQRKANATLPVVFIDDEW